jgi:uncharacterized protein (DUF2342 family)
MSQRKVTDRVTIGKMSVWVSNNAEKLSGMKMEEIDNVLRKEFNGSFLSKDAIVAACNAGGVTPRRAGKGVQGKDRLRILARIVERFVDKVETELGGTFLSDEDRETLSSLKS